MYPTTLDDLQQLLTMLQTHNVKEYRFHGAAGVRLELTLGAGVAVPLPAGSVAGPTRTNADGSKEVEITMPKEARICRCGHDLDEDHTEHGCLRGCPIARCVPDELVAREATDG